MTSRTEEPVAKILRRWWPWITLVGFLVLLYLLKPILAPFLIAAGLAYLGDPIVDWLEERKLSRTLAVTVVFLVLSALGIISLLILIPMLQAQIQILIARTPQYLTWLQTQFAPLMAPWFPDGFEFSSIKSLAKEYQGQAGAVLPKLLGTLSKSGMAFAAFLGNLILIPVVSFYLLRDWDILVERVANLLPRRYLDTVTRLSRESDQVLSSFIRGQLLVMFSLSVLYSFGLWMAGLELAMLIGLLAGAVSFVPYLGFIVGILAASIAMILQTQELLPLVWVALVFGVGQVVESSILTPLLVGDRIGLHPVMVIFAVLAGGQLFGFVGVLLALPAAAVIAVMVRHLLELWIESELYNASD